MSGKAKVKLPRFGVGKKVVAPAEPAAPAPETTKPKKSVEELYAELTKAVSVIKSTIKESIVPMIFTDEDGKEVDVKAIFGESACGRAAWVQLISLLTNYEKKVLSKINPQKKTKKGTMKGFAAACYIHAELSDFLGIQLGHPLRPTDDDTESGNPVNPLNSAILSPALATKYFTTLIAARKLTNPKEKSFFRLDDHLMTLFTPDICSRVGIASTEKVKHTDLQKLLNVFYYSKSEIARPTLTPAQTEAIESMSAKFDEVKQKKEKYKAAVDTVAKCNSRVEGIRVAVEKGDCPADSEHIKAHQRQLALALEAEKDSFKEFIAAARQAGAA